MNSLLTAYYDLHVSPASYDVVAFLLAAENWRIRQGAERVRIEILPGPRGGFRQDSLWPQDLVMRQQMLDRVVVPMCKMLPSGDVVVRGDRPNRRDTRDGMGFMTRHYGLLVQVEILRRGIRPLRAPDDGRGSVFCDKRLVTITLREAEHWPERNSNVPAWLVTSQEIERRGYDVVVIRDTRRAFEPLPDDRPHSMEAALHLDWRALLYSSAMANLGVSNGPLWFALALDAPVLMLKPTTENLMGTCGSDYFAACGVPPCGQIPGSPAYQRLVWADDTAENILAAFDDFMAHDSAAAA